MPTAKCLSCGEIKPHGDFYKGFIRDDGTKGSRCKQCHKQAVRTRARTNPAVQEYDRARAKRPERKAKARAITKAWRQRNPEGYAAQTAVSNAVRDGKLTREPCLFCGRDDVHAHHKDYAKPLDVVWLCPSCHHRLHATFPETEGLNKTSEARP